MPETLTAPVKTKYPETITDDDAKRIITPLIKIDAGERLDICRVAERCFRVNVWAAPDADAMVGKNRIDRSYFVTIKADDVTVT